MKKAIVLLGLALLVALIAACGGDEAQPTATALPAAEPTDVPPTEEPAAEAPDLSMLTDNPWQWMSYVGGEDYFDVESPESYLVAFNDDGTVNIVADCNNASGSYTEDAGSLSIEIGPVTMAACPPESRSDQFITYLGSAAFAFFEDGYLYIDLFADGGTLSFIWADAGTPSGAEPSEPAFALDPDTERVTPPPALSERERGIVEVPCELGEPRGANEVEGETYYCGILTVPMFWEDPDSPNIDLQFIVTKATGDDPEPDPLVYLAGGPGQSSVNTAITAYDKIRPTHDIVRMDQRGTGISQRLGLEECLVLAVKDESASDQLSILVQFPSSRGKTSRRRRPHPTPI